MEEMKDKAIKEIDEMWDREIKKQFSNQINECFKETLEVLVKELDSIDSSMNKHIQELDQQYEKKWKKKYNDQISQMQQMIEKKENLRKKVININNIQDPPLIKLLFIDDTNPLVNIVLQCISNIKTLVSYYFNPKKEEKILHKAKIDPNNCYLGPSFLKLLDYLWKSKQKEYYPEEIHNTLKRLMGDNYNAKDPSIIINFILTKLNEELTINNDLNPKKEIDPFSVFDENNVLNEYWNDFMKQKTKITMSFYSTFKISKRCPGCNYKAFSFESSPIINVYLNQENPDLLYFENFKYHLIKKEKETIKEICVLCADGEEKTKIVVKDIQYTPEILIINIDRKKDPEYRISFKYPEQFDIQNIVQQEMEISDYVLTTVIKKDNDSYIAFCRNYIDKQWYSYNNERIELVDNYKDVIIDDKNACILIYTGKKKIKNV